jgi:hypothetical protein
MEGMEKQTAIDWLKQKWYSDENDITDETFEQAKEMEKEQIKDAWDNGCEYISENSEQYYNKTFKSA